MYENFPKHLAKHLETALKSTVDTDALATSLHKDIGTQLQYIQRKIQELTDGMKQHIHTLANGEQRENVIKYLQTEEGYDATVAAFYVDLVSPKAPAE